MMRPARGVVFVRRIGTEDRIGRLYVPDQAKDRITWLQWEIVQLGEPDMCRDEDCERHHELPDAGAKWFDDDRGYHVTPDLAPGDWVLLYPRSWTETPEAGLYAVTYDGILGKYVEGGRDVANAA